jgi:hypothetical protein
VRGLRIGLLVLLAGIIVPASGALAALPRQPTADPGGIEVRLLEVPGQSSDDPLARSYIVERLAPGAHIRRRVEISNNTRASAAVAVYPAAAILRRGRFVFAPDRSQNELSSWTSISRAVLRLAPGTKAVETLTIEVPKQASSRKRYAVIWAQVSAPAATGGGVRLVNRVGVRIYLSIGPGGAAAANFVIGPLSAQRLASGEPLVVAKIHNNGQRTLGISGTLTLSAGPGGLRAGPFPVQPGMALAPDDSRLATVRLDKALPRGPWRADLRLRSGRIQRAAVATIEFPGKAGAAKPAMARDARYLFVIAIILLALLAAAALALLRSRR